MRHGQQVEWITTCALWTFSLSLSLRSVSLLFFSSRINYFWPSSHRQREQANKMRMTDDTNNGTLGAVALFLSEEKGGNTLVSLVWVRETNWFKVWSTGAAGSGQMKREVSVKRQHAKWWNMQAKQVERERGEWMTRGVSWRASTTKSTGTTVTQDVSGVSGEVT